jgi:hypothetical protein
LCCCHVVPLTCREEPTCTDSTSSPRTVARSQPAGASPRSAGGAVLAHPWNCALWRGNRVICVGFLVTTRGVTGARCNGVSRCLANGPDLMVRCAPTPASGGTIEEP